MLGLYEECGSNIGVSLGFGVIMENQMETTGIIGVI